MRKSSENFKFTVSDDDDIIDLRQLEQASKRSDRKNSLKSKANVKASKTELHAGDQKLPNAGFPNLSDCYASHLERGSGKYHRTHSPVLLRGNKKRLMNRAVSADPRFRKTRSPERKASTSASEVTLASQSVHNKSDQPVSVSTPSFKRNAYRASASVSDNKSTRSNVSRKTSRISKKTSREYVLQDSSSQTNHYQKPEDVPVTKVCNQETTIDSLSNYVSDFPKIQSTQSVSPYWDDPRLLHKYSNLLKMTQLKRTKSTWTLPICSSKHILVPTSEESCAHTVERNTYKYDDGTDVSSINAVILQRPNFADIAKRNCYLVLFFSIGSCIGLLLATILIYVFVTNVLPWVVTSFQTEQPKINNKSLIHKMFLFVTGTIVYVLDTVVKSIVRLLVLSRAEIYQTNIQQQPATTTSWLQNLFT